LAWQVTFRITYYLYLGAYSQWHIDILYFKFELETKILEPFFAMQKNGYNLL